MAETNPRPDESRRGRVIAKAVVVLLATLLLVSVFLNADHRAERRLREMRSRLWNERRQRYEREQAALEAQTPPPPTTQARAADVDRDPEHGR